jgi:hypothetical protein
MRKVGLLPVITGACLEGLNLVIELGSSWSIVTEQAPNVSVLFRAARLFGI